jgi:competence protein ComEA
LPSSKDTLTPQQYKKQSDSHSESVVIQQFPVNINEATLEELQALPKIGPAMARRIIEYRQTNGPFRTAREIVKVRGIGEKTFQKLQDLITVK